MSTLRSAIEQTVAISSFNRGLAGKIFSEVNKTGAKVVMKNNTAECVLLPPAEYISMLDELHDARLLVEAIERMNGYRLDKTLTQKEIDQEFGFDESMLDDGAEVELE